MKRLIPKSREEDLLGVFWAMLVTAEGRIDPRRDVLDRMDVEAGYRLLNDIGYTTLQPRWLARVDEQAAELRETIKDPKRFAAYLDDLKS